MDTMNLPVKLTQEELDQRRDKLASLIRAKKEVEIMKRDETAAYGKQLKDMDEELSGLAQEIRERAEYREVAISRSKDFKRGVEEIYRDDTGVVVDSRPLRPDEKQAELGLIQADDETAELRAEAEGVK